MREIVNNKEGRPLEYYSGLYRALEPERAAERCGLRFDSAASCFELMFMGSVYSASFPEFELRLTRRGTKIDCAENDNAVKILLMRFLINGSKRIGSGSFVTYREVPWGEAYLGSFNGRCIRRLAYSYDRARDKFAPAMELLGAEKIKGGDEGYELEFMDGLFVRFLVWAGDDEFPPSAQILFSDNFPSAFSAEDMAVTGDICIGALKKAQALL